MVAHLVEASEWPWISVMQQDVDTLRSMLARFPEAGRELDRVGDKTIRRLKLHRAPFFAWYSFDPEPAPGLVELYRLIHAHQRSPRPDFLL